MSKRYMDFVPSKPVKAVDGRQQRIVTREVVRATPKKAEEFNVGTKRGLSRAKKPVLGVVEEVEPKSTGDTKRRNLEKTSHFRPVRTEVAEAKARKVGNQAARKVDFNKDEVKKAEGKKVYEPPKAPFINQEKVVKRPLSKNVYKKKIEVPKEEPKGPVTIITKPEKDAHVSLIVTIILTIILGAAAGTVAFLLLPK